MTTRRGGQHPPDLALLSPSLLAGALLLALPAASAASASGAAGGAAATAGRSVHIIACGLGRAKAPQLAARGARAATAHAPSTAVAGLLALASGDEAA
mgnify:CR=1 FL=1